MDADQKRVKVLERALEIVDNESGLRYPCECDKPCPFEYNEEDCYNKQEYEYCWKYYAIKKAEKELKL